MSQSYCTDLCGEFDKVVQIGRDGQNALKSIQTFFEERSAAEETYGRNSHRLSKTNVDALYPSSLSAHVALRALQTYAEAVGKAHFDYARYTSELIVSEVTNLKNDLGASFKQLSSDGQRWAKEHANEVEKVAKSKAKYYKACRDADAAQANYERAMKDPQSAVNGMAAKAGARYQAALRDSKQAEVSYSQEVQRAREFQAKYRKGMSEILSKFQENDEQRLTSIRDLIAIHISLEEKIIAQRQKALSSIKGALDAMNPCGDVQKLIGMLNPCSPPFSSSSAPSGTNGLSALVSTILGDSAAALESVERDQPQTSTLPPVGGWPLDVEFEPYQSVPASDQSVAAAGGGFVRKLSLTRRDSTSTATAYVSTSTAHVPPPPTSESPSPSPRRPSPSAYTDLAERERTAEYSTIERYTERMFDCQELEDGEEVDLVARLGTQSGRLAFAEALNAQRAKPPGTCLPDEPFSFLVHLIQTSLMRMEPESEVQAGRLFMNMSQTFYRKPSASVFKDSESGNKDTIGTPKSEEKEFVQAHVRDLGLWQNLRFWEGMFFDAIHSERLKQDYASRWKDLGAEMQEESRRRDENITFGQLGSFSFNMINMGLPCDKVLAFVRKMCDINTINEAYVQMLLTSAQDQGRQYQEELAKQGELRWLNQQRKDWAQGMQEQHRKRRAEQAERKRSTTDSGDGDQEGPSTPRQTYLTRFSPTTASVADGENVFEKTSEQTDDTTRQN